MMNSVGGQGPVSSSPETAFFLFDSLVFKTRIRKFAKFHSERILAPENAQRETHPTLELGQVCGNYFSIVARTLLRPHCTTEEKWLSPCHFNLNLFPRLH